MSLSSHLRRHVHNLASATFHTNTRTTKSIGKMHRIFDIMIVGLAIISTATSAWPYCLHLAGMTSQLLRSICQTRTPRGNFHWSDPPFISCDTSGFIPNEYIVYLTPPYSLEKHKLKVGPELDAAIRHVYNDTITAPPFRRDYYGAVLSDTLLSRVLEDEYVYMVECNRKAQPYTN